MFAVDLAVHEPRALGTSGETVWRVPSLALPPPAATKSAEIGAADAVQFFVARAKGARPGFALSDRNAAAVADICRRLDGIPLALELASTASRWRWSWPRRGPGRFHSIASRRS